MDPQDSTEIQWHSMAFNGHKEKEAYWYHNLEGIVMAGSGVSRTLFHRSQSGDSVP